MSDLSSKVLKAAPNKVASVMALGRTPARAWRAGELAAVFQHQMAAPVAVDLGAVDATLSGKLRTLTEASGLLLKSFHDLLTHPEPPLELLHLLKDFAKRNREHPESAIPNEVATVLYYLSIAAALARLDTRITSLADAQLRDGFASAIAQDWVDQESRMLLQKAMDRLSNR